MKVLFFALFYLIFFITVEVISRRYKLNREYSRKIVHVIAGTTAGFLPFVMSFNEIAVLSFLFIPVLFISKKFNVLGSIHAVKRKTYGEIYFPVVILLMAISFQEKFIFMYGLLIMGISDGLAAIIGEKYGKKKYRIFSVRKTYIGSVTFFIASFLISVVVLFIFNAPFAQALILVVLLSAILTIVEAFLSAGLDNLILSPLAAILLLMALKFLLH